MSNLNKLDVVFITGPPGIGKTSMAVNYQNKNTHVEQFGNGDLMRDLRIGRVCSKYSEIIHRATENRELLPDHIFADAVYEKVMSSKDDTETLFITGFPYAYGDWIHFYETIQNTNGVRALGAIALSASMQTCVGRMQKRDIHNGMSYSDVYAERSLADYKERYLAHLARSAIRLDCFDQSNVETIFISAEKSQDSVFDNFTNAVRDLKREGRLY